VRATWSAGFSLHQADPLLCRIIPGGSGKGKFAAAVLAGIAFVPHLM